MAYLVDFNIAVSLLPYLYEASRKIALADRPSRVGTENEMIFLFVIHNRDNIQCKKIPHLGDTIIVFNKDSTVTVF